MKYLQNVELHVKKSFHSSCHSIWKSHVSLEVKRRLHGMKIDYQELLTAITHIAWINLPSHPKKGSVFHTAWKGKWVLFSKTKWYSVICSMHNESDSATRPRSPYRCSVSQPQENTSGQQSMPVGAFSTLSSPLRWGMVKRRKIIPHAK